MNLPIKQHIIPKTYLKQFKNTEDKIWVYQKDVKHLREQSISKVPIIKDFYTVTDYEEGGKKLYDFEIFLANEIEPLYSPNIERLHKGEILDEAMKQQFAYFVSPQKLRTVIMKDKIIKEIENAFRYEEAGEWFDKTSIEQFTQNYFEDGIEITYEEFFERSGGNLGDVSVDISKDCYVQFLPEKMIEFADTLKSQNWSYLKAPKGRNFITSDNPVILEKEIEVSNYSLEGGIFPLSPQLALNINTREEKFRTLGAKEMRWINKVIVGHSDRFIFSQDKNLLMSIIRKYL